MVSFNFRNEETETQVSAMFMATKLLSRKLDFKPDLMTLNLMFFPLHDAAN